MIPTFTTPFRITAAAIAMLALMIMASDPLPAQSAGETAAETPAGDTTAQPAAVETSARDLAATPSRNVEPDQLKSYVDSVSAVFSMRNRVTDPFGLVQDPNAKPVVKPKLATRQRFEPVKATPFSDIVKLIKVTTVMPGERTFLVGTRQINQGDRIPVTFRGRNIMIEVAAVGSDRIMFRNLEDDEIASLSLNLLPAGMSPGADGITAPGMEPENSDAPLNLDGNAIPLNAVQNR